MTPAKANPGKLLPEETVKLAYELMLGRQVESDKTLQSFRKVGTVPALRAAMINSAEFAKRLGPTLTGNWLNALARQPTEVEYEVSPKQVELLFKRIRDQWTKLGDTEPHWSVLTNDDFKTENFAAHEERFYKSGYGAFSLVEASALRGNVDLPTDGTVFELGCGTGRITHVLSEKFAKVIAADVSPGNLKLCEEKMRQLGRTNVEFLLLKSPKDIKKIPPIDFFFSVIVLQHNPPPVIHYFLSEICSKIRSGGAVYFQVPNYRLSYSFDVEKYLASPHGVMDMHCLPMPAVFEVFAKNGLQPVEVLADAMTGFFGSHFFFAVKG